MQDSYWTIEKETRTEIKVKGSRFIGETFRVETVESALERLTSVRKREYQATHHCYAYVVGLPDNVEFKYSDDGEPSGTAGRPIYDVITGHELSNTMVVVIRYFGGTKLGTGGLVRAYSDAARAAVEASGRRENLITRDFRMIFEFPMYDRWLKELHRTRAEVIDSEFAANVILRVRIRLSLADQLVAKFTEMSSGRGKVEEIEP